MDDEIAWAMFCCAGEIVCGPMVRWFFNLRYVTSNVSAAINLMDGLPNEVAFSLPQFLDCKMSPMTRLLWRWMNNLQNMMKVFYKQLITTLQ